MLFSSEARARIGHAVALQTTAAILMAGANDVLPQNRLKLVPSDLFRAYGGHRVLFSSS